MDNPIPVFYHIPKNAGTYVQLKMLLGIRRLYRPVAQVDILNLTSNNRIIARVIATGIDRVCKYDDKVKVIHRGPAGCVAQVDYNYFVENRQSQSVSIIVLIIEAAGWRIHQQILDQLIDEPFVRFMLLREPFNRSVSLYNYLTTDRSKHELTHGSIQSTSLEQYLTSYEVEDCWLLRALLDLPNDKVIEQSDFDMVCQQLDSMYIDDISNVDLLLNKIFNKCFGTALAINTPKVFRNESKVKNKVTLESFSQQVIDKFKGRTQWHYKLYERYITTRR